MWQAEHVKKRIISLYPRCAVEILGMTTRGDRVLDRPLMEVGGKGLFVKELEVAMAEGRADLAVHSLKDVPFGLPEGFMLSAILEREDPRDAFVSNKYQNFDALPEGAIVGTGSLRRQSAIAVQYPQVVIRPLRGNVDTRMSKLDAGEYDAIILAAAGLKRLGCQERISAYIDVDQIIPAPGQGAMAIEIRSDREDLKAVCASLNHLASMQSVRAERAVAARLGGSCHVPLAAFARFEEGVLRLRAMVATLDGKLLARSEAVGVADAPEALGQSVAESLIEQGAVDILRRCNAV